MRNSAARRYAFALFFAVLAGLLVHFYNPIDHLKADLRADAQGLRITLELAADQAEHAPDRATAERRVLPKPA